MTKIYTSITQLIGKTPLVELSNIKQFYNLEANIIAKVELFNPAGSIKDRIALAMINEAEEKGLLQKGGTIVEPTSGNTGIGLASIAATKGYSIILTMPDTMSVERRNLLKAYGAKLVLTNGAKGMNGAIEIAKELLKSTPNSFMPSQFTNMANPNIHYKTTGPEIWNDTDGNVDILVAGIGTGGTISGVGKYLKEQNHNIKIIAVEPTSSPILSQRKSGPHMIQGIGAGFIPDTLNKEIYDEIITVSNEDAFEAGRKLATQEGLLVGVSSGAALHVAIEVAQREENIGKNIVVIFPDTGERYLSTPMFQV